MSGRPIINMLPPEEIEDMMARQSLDLALDILGPAEVLRVTAQRVDNTNRPGLRAG